MQSWAGTQLANCQHKGGEQLSPPCGERSHVECRVEADAPEVWESKIPSIHTQHLQVTFAHLWRDRKRTHTLPEALLPSAPVPSVEEEPSYLQKMQVFLVPDTS